MNDYKLLPVEPTQDMLSRVMNIVTGYSGEYGQYNNYLDEETAREMYAAFLADTPAVQMEVVGWQFYEDGKWWNGDDRIKDHRKNTKEGGYPIRDVYATQQPVEQSTFTVGTDLSDGRLTVVVMRHENNITWVIHSEVIQLAEQQPDVTQLVEALEEIRGLPSVRQDEAAFIAGSALDAHRSKGVRHEQAT